MKNKNNLHVYTNEEITWLTEYINIYSLEKLTKEFNKKFNNTVGFEALRKWCYNHNIKKDRGVRIHLTEEQSKWILNNYKKYDLPNIQKFDYETFTKEFESIFNLKLNKNTIFDFLHKMNIKMEYDRGRTKPKNYRRPDRDKIGTEIIRHGIVYVKVNDIKKTKDISSTRVFFINYKAKKRIIYEQLHNVTLCKDDIIIQLDGNIHNFEKENLFHIKAQELRCMSVKLWDFWDLLDDKTKKLILLECKLRSKIYKEEKENEEK